MPKRINPQAFLEFICFSFFAALIFYLTISGKYLSYVTPKMAPYLYFTSAVMLVWAVSKFPVIFRPQHRTRAAHCLVLVIPILLLLLPYSAVSASGVSSGYLNGNSFTSVSGSTSSAGAKTKEITASQGDSSTTNDSTVAETASDGDTSGNASSADTSSDNSTADTAGAAETDGQYDDSIIKQYGLELSEDGSINVSDDMFYPWLSEIFANMKRYEGVTITIKGFVFKDSRTMSDSEFVPARLLMYCCTADLSPCGIICEYDKASELTENSWVTVTGVIQIGEYQGEDEPEIHVTSISPAEEPEEEYVYPW